MDTGDRSGGTRPSFKVTAPRDPGDYDLGLSGSTSEGCSSGTVGAKKVLPKALNVLAPGVNPNLPPRCGINVMLVLDESGSIASSHQTETVREATRAFLTPCRAPVRWCRSWTSAAARPSRCPTRR